MTTARQDSDISETVKECVIEKINEMDLADVIIDAILKVCDPEDIFPFKELAQWAEDNGYVKE